MSSAATTINDFQQENTSLSHPARPFLWSVRRELWEFRSIYLAPLGVAVLVIVSSLVSMGHVGHQMRDAAALGAMEQQEIIQRPYNYAALFLMGISFLVAIFYCLEALNTERRDRSILFWKSLPVSDLTTVLSKICVPMIVIPVIVIALTIVTHLIMLLLNVAVLSGNGLSLEMLWANLPLREMWLMQAYHMLVLHGLWMAPGYAWMLLVSGWARRLVLLWAAAPLVVVGVVEKIVFNSNHVGGWLLYRFGGAPAGNAYPGGHMAFHTWSHLHLADVLLSPGIWTGLAFAALCVFAAARVRRSRGPV